MGSRQAAQKCAAHGQVVGFASECSRQRFGCLAVVVLDTRLGTGDTQQRAQVVRQSDGVQRTQNEGPRINSRVSQATNDMPRLFRAPEEAASTRTSPTEVAASGLARSSPQTVGQLVLPRPPSAAAFPRLGAASPAAPPKQELECLVWVTAIKLLREFPKCVLRETNPWRCCSRGHSCPRVALSSSPFTPPFAAPPPLSYCRE